MSYILEVLRKIEQQKRIRESEPGSWVGELTREPAKTAVTRDSRKRFIVAFSILLVICGVSTGLFFSQRSIVPEVNIKLETTIKKEPPSKSAQKVKTPEPKIEPDIRIEPSLEPVEKKTPPKGVTLSEAASSPFQKVDVQNRNPAPSRGRTKEPIEKNTKVLTFSKSQTTVDLTNRFKLSSTGINAKGRYASIEGVTYYLGDEFEGMILTDIQRDRVFLKEKNGWQQFKIVFRYKK